MSRDMRTSQATLRSTDVAWADEQVSLNQEDFPAQGPHTHLEYDVSRANTGRDLSHPSPQLVDAQQPRASRFSWLPNYCLRLRLIEEGAH